MPDTYDMWGDESSPLAGPRDALHKVAPIAPLAQSPLNRSERVVLRASAIRLAVDMVGECQPRSISPRYLPSIFGIRRATSSSVSSNSSRRWRIASPSFRVSGSARVRLGNGGGLIAVHGPASLDFFYGYEHSTCSPSGSEERR